MSLINDALKRAQTAQRPILPVPRAELRPVNDPPAPRPKFGLPVLLLAGVACFPLIALLVVRLALHGDSADILANASSPRTTAAAQPIAPPAPPPAPAAQSAPLVAAPPTTTVSHPPAASDKLTATVAASPAPVGQSNGAPPAVEAAKPLAPRLQTIVFDPTHPSAMINGRVAFVGDKLPEGKVVAISQDKVTLNTAGETIVLTLSE